jgi:hypothetical protein
LIAPGNTSTQDIFTLTGGDGADSSNLNGTYNYFDTATNNWWAAASAVGDTTAIPPGDYRASNGSGQNVSLDPVFANLGNPNGTWILRFNDCVPQDTGTVTAASLRLTGQGSAPLPSALDISGRVTATDGRGIGKADVTITGPGNFALRTLTNALGYYRFENIPTGVTYTLTVNGKRYTFTPRQVALTNTAAAQQDFVGQRVSTAEP